MMSELHYCNLLLYNTPNIPFDKLQHIQNVLAHVVTQSTSRSLNQYSSYTGLCSRSVNYEMPLLVFKAQTHLVSDETCHN